MKTKTLRLSDIKMAEYNPRRELKPGDEEYERLKNSITEFGFVEPIIVNVRNMTLVGGHQRYNVLKDLGETETEAIVVDLDEAGEKTLNVALNKIEGDWDTVKLQELFRELSAESIERTSFSKIEIDDILHEMHAAEAAIDAGELGDADTDVTVEGNSEKNDSSQTDDDDPKPFEIYLSFSTQEAADEWLAAHGVNRAFTESRSIVLNMEEADANAVG